jgi:hypothetical protein
MRLKKIVRRNDGTFKPLPKPSKRDLIRVYGKKITLNKAGKIFGVTGQTISKWLRQYGIKQERKTKINWSDPKERKKYSRKNYLKNRKKRLKFAINYYRKNSPNILASRKNTEYRARRRKYEKSPEQKTRRRKYEQRPAVKKRRGSQRISRYHNNIEASRGKARKNYQKYGKKIRKSARKNRQKNPEKMRAIEKKYYDAKGKLTKQKSKEDRKRKVFTEYSKQVSGSNVICCAKCGLIDKLEFFNIDHITGRKSMGHPHGFGGDILYRELEEKAFPDGFQVLCWNCNYLKELTIRRKNLLQTPQAVYSRKKDATKKLQVISHYSNDMMECACCGFSNYDALTKDHIEPRKKLGHSRNTSGGNLDMWLINNDFPPGIQILCFNCNSAKRDRGFCPHQKHA